MNKDLQISILTEELTVARALLRIKEAELVKARSDLELAKMKDTLFFNDNDNFWELITESEKVRKRVDEEWILGQSGRRSK